MRWSRVIIWVMGCGICICREEDAGLKGMELVNVARERKRGKKKEMHRGGVGVGFVGNDLLLFFFFFFSFREELGMMGDFRLLVIDSWGFRSTRKLSTPRGRVLRGNDSTHQETEVIQSN